MELKTDEFAWGMKVFEIKEQANYIVAENLLSLSNNSA